MDSDDWYPSHDVLESLYCVAKRYGTNISGGSLVWWDEKDEDILMINQDYIFSSDGKIDFADYQMPYAYQRFIYSRKMLLEDNIIFPDYLRGQDPPFFVNAMLSAKSFYAISKPTYCYRYGHKKVNWDIKKSNDLMQSFIDLLVVSVTYNYSRLHVLVLRAFHEHYCECITSKTYIHNTEFSNLINEVNKYISPDLIKKECSSKILKHLLPFGLIFKNSLNPGCMCYISYLKSKTLVYYWSAKSLHQMGLLSRTLVKKYRSR